MAKEFILLFKELLMYVLLDDALCMYLCPVPFCLHKFFFRNSSFKDSFWKNNDIMGRDSFPLFFAAREKRGNSKGEDTKNQAEMPTSNTSLTSLTPSHSL
jgi:hypothetical protein